MLGILFWLLIFGGIGYLIAGTTGLWVGLGIVFVFLLLLIAFFGGALAFMALLFKKNQ